MNPKEYHLFSACQICQVLTEVNMKANVKSFKTFCSPDYNTMNQKLWENKLIPTVPAAEYMPKAYTVEGTEWGNAASLLYATWNNEKGVRVCFTWWDLHPVMQLLHFI